MNFKKILNNSEWENLFQRTLFKTFFHSPEWEKFLEKEFKWLKFERYLYKDSALLCLAHFKIFGRDRFVSHPFCEYGGPLPLKEGIDFDEFKKDILSQFKNIKIRLHPEILKYADGFQLLPERSRRHMQSLNKNLSLPQAQGPFDFAQAIKSYNSSLKTYFIENLKTLNSEQLFHSFRKTLRHSIQKAEKENIIIKPCQNIRELKEFYRLHLLNIKRQKTWAFPYSFFEYFYASADAEIILAEFENKIIGGSVFLFYDKFAHYFINASDQKYKHLGANYLISWSQIKKYLGKEYEIFDLGGTRSGSLLEVFKQGWCAKPYPILQIGGENKVEARRPRHSILRNIWSFLPLSTMPQLNRLILKYVL